MLKLKKYFKKYWLLFVLAIVCIFGQAYTELTLPDYMSDKEYLEICKDKMRHMEEVCSRGLTKEDHDAVLHMIDMIIKNMEDELKEEDDA